MDKRLQTPPMLTHPYDPPKPSPLNAKTKPHRTLSAAVAETNPNPGAQSHQLPPLLSVRLAGPYGAENGLVFHDVKRRGDCPAVGVGFRDDSAETN